LQAYRLSSESDRLWVLFRDETNGETTYGTGRYLDLTATEYQTDDENWILDLNEAYNPTDAYNHAYECPLVPMENWLDMAVEAGERSFSGEPADPSGQLP
jgi:uncharacterized protein (DUF1684 family)